LVMRYRDESETLHAHVFSASGRARLHSRFTFVMRLSRAVRGETVTWPVVELVEP